MFLKNKYEKWYFSIIEKARQDQRDKKVRYFEAHHVIPRSLGGNNKRENIVLLTAREHFVCHRLLTKMLPYKSQEWFKMTRCMVLFKRTHKDMAFVKINSRTFEILKKDISSFMIENYDREKDIVRRTKISKTMKERWAANKYNNLKGRFVSEDTKKLISLAAKSSYEMGTRKERKDARPKDFKKEYTKVMIRKGDKTKEVGRNQVPQYSKYGWSLALKGL
jgi:hypothetical protein